MRFYRKATIVISEDDSTTPKDIRYKIEDNEITDITLLKDVTSGSASLAASTVDFPLPMPQVTSGKYLLLKADKPFAAKINGSANFLFAANKPNELWCDFTQVQITNSDVAVALRLSWVIGGD